MGLILFISMVFWRWGGANEKATEYAEVVM